MSISLVASFDVLPSVLGHLVTNVFFNVHMDAAQGNLPLLPYAPLFYHTQQTLLLSHPIPFLKNWFLLVRSGRECFSLNHLVDDFTTNTILCRVWVGLSPTQTAIS